MGDQKFAHAQCDSAAVDNPQILSQQQSNVFTLFCAYLKCTPSIENPVDCEVRAAFLVLNMQKQLRFTSYLWSLWKKNISKKSFRAPKDATVFMKKY